MKKLFIFLILSALLLEACNKGKGNENLEKKKAELNDKKKQYATLKEEISTLEKEVARMEGKDTLRKGKSVAVQAVAQAPFTHYIEVQGRVESDQNVTVSAQTPGTVQHILVKEGQPVKKGQLLAEIDAASMASQLQGMRTNVEFLRTMYDKQKRLRQQNVGTEVGLLQAKSQYEGAQAQLESLERQINNARITSPINGVVDARMITEGAQAMPGFPAFRIVGGSGYKVTARISESYLSSVKKGMEVLVNFPDINQEIKGTINSLSQYIDPASRTFTADISIKDNDLIRPNLIAVVKIKDYQAPKSITVPVNAIQHSEEGEEFVLVAQQKGDHFVASKRQIRKGITYGGRTEIVQGLNPGDKVITTGQQDLVDDQPVKIKG